MITMYHRFENKPKSCSPKQFEQQVKLAKQLGAKLTFDDGLKSQYTIAYPILKKYKMKGTFFYITNCQEAMCTVHKIWLLLEYFKKELLRVSKVSDKRNPKLPLSYYQFDDIQTRNLKYYLATHEDLVDKFFDVYFDEDEEIEKMYMTYPDIWELYKNGMEIGSHSHTHPLLSKLSRRKQEYEIKISTEIIEELTEPPLGFSYPNGFHNKTTINLLKKYGYKYAVTVEKDNIFELGRIDTNDFD